jgi:hypothetical protein
VLPADDAAACEEELQAYTTLYWRRKCGPRRSCGISGRSRASWNARSRRYTAQKQELLTAYASSSATMVDFCVQHGITTASPCT